MELAILVGAALGLRCRIGLVIVATVTIIISTFAWHLAHHESLAAALGLSLLAAAAMQSVGFLVQIVREASRALFGRSRPAGIGRLPRAVPAPEAAMKSRFTPAGGSRN